MRITNHEAISSRLFSFLSIQNLIIQGISSMTGMASNKSVLWQTLRSRCETSYHGGPWCIMIGKIDGLDGCGPKSDIVLALAMETRSGAKTSSKLSLVLTRR